MGASSTSERAVTLGVSNGRLRVEFQEVIRRRRMIRAYRPEPVDEDVLERIVGTARRAPSAGFSQGQRFVIVVAEETRAAIAGLAGEDRYVQRGYPRWLSTAPAHVVLCVDRGAYIRRYAEPDKPTASGPAGWPVPYWYVDAGASLMSLLLAAVDEGLAAGFLGIHRLGGVEDLLDVPDGIETVGLVTIGYPAEGSPRSRSLDRGWQARETVISWERWGGRRGAAGGGDER
jgi:nitroreductase